MSWLCSLLPGTLSPAQDLRRIEQVSTEESESTEWASDPPAEMKMKDGDQDRDGDLDQDQD